VERGQHYPGREEGVVEIKSQWMALVLSSFALIRWSAAAMSAKSPALSHRTLEGQGTLYNLVGVVKRHVECPR